MPRPIHRLVVLSDAHLGAVPVADEDALLGFLDRVPGLGDGLLINGDLFGFWFAYRRALPRAGFRIVTRLAELARRLPVMMTGGNHDRWGSPFWEELGIQYSPGELRFLLGESPVRARHGDRVPGGALRTRLKAAVIGSPLASLVYRALPADLGFLVTLPLARPARSPHDLAEEERTAARQKQWAEELLGREPDVGLLILGHSHRPVAIEVSPGHRYLNPGAWFDGYRYAIATEHALELNQFRG